MVGYLFLLLLVGAAQGNSFSKSDIQDLFEVERSLILNLRNYAKELQGKLRIIKGALDEYSEHVKDATRNPELYLSNPLNTFKLIRHMSLDWAAWQLKMEEQLGEEQIQMQQRLLSRTPDKSTLKTAAQRLQSLFKFYNLEPASFLQVNHRHLRLDPVDCYYMGMELYEQEKYHEAVKWLTVAADNFNSSPHNDLIGVPHWRVYEMKSKVFLSLNKFLESHKALSTAIELNPGNQQLLEQQWQLEQKSRNNEKDPIPAPAVILSDLQQQCAGESRQDNTLSCELITNVTPFLELAPLRVEDLYYYPYVMIYKDGIYDREIQHIRNAFLRCPSRNKFEEGGGILGCLIPDSYSSVIRTLGVRMKDMAGLDNDIDGIFVMEYDSTSPLQPFKLPYLDFIDLQDVTASAILFLNDVALGGALTIPNLDVVVYPQRGDALVTFNAGNFEHTLCPKMVGSSMIIVKFMRDEESEEEKEHSKMLQFRLLRSIVSLLIFTVVLVACQSNGSHQNRDYITSLTDKLELLSQNEKLHLNLMDYVDQMQERIDIVKRLAKYLRQPLQSAKGREKEFLSNPLNGFSLLRHMQSDWTHVLRLLEQPVGQEQIDFVRQMQKIRPQIHEVRDSMAAIHRIKEIYKLKSWDMARGLLEGVQYNAKLSYLDCYELGYLYYNSSQFKRAEEWLVTARHLITPTQADLHSILGVTRSDISFLLARSLSAMGNSAHARAVLLEEPQFSGAVEEWLDYFKANMPEKVENEQLKEFEPEYHRLCSSNYKSKPSRLLCSFKRTPTPFLRLAPFKMEQLSLDPYVVVFHDVVYSWEIAALERATKSLMERASVSNAKTRRFIVSSVRTVSGVWLPHYRFSSLINELVERIRQRIKDLSGLIIDSSIHRNIQLLNYGYGGHYLTHNDFLNITTTNYFYDDRIATVLIYLNDVTSGGATIFPQLNLAVKPERGKVLHWHNTVPGSFDYETRCQHAACPVLVGNKLAMTQWIHEGDQMFHKPCLSPPKDRKYY
ncbi:prolyl 4-hydroxylase subunit alpha-1-like [Drosophila innubila]|uniref:prolyl 4-hydroxylase subunit alpha-1-like n=1 Tax=Drosophila innubila TaxID=198719 RepID=UPI00148C97D9|nr:prolyl 4-hydroxylase subunit alpha-1-like [Drosophila innubila]